MNINKVIAGFILTTTLGSAMAVQAGPHGDASAEALRHSVIQNVSHSNSHYNNHYNRYDRDYRHENRHQRQERLGRVLEVRPIWGQDDRSCRVSENRLNRDEARVIGALAGGAVGNLIGREHDNALVGTVAGVLIGSAGADIIVRHDDRRRGKECVPKHKLKYHQQPVAYWVRYSYRGQVYSTRTRKHPGRYIEIDNYYGRRG